MSNEAQGRVRRRPSIAAVVATIIALVAGVAVGAVVGGWALGRTETAEARLVVGDQSIRAQSVPGYALATQQLAATYSRLIATPAESGEGVSASPIPDSAIIRVQAKSQDAASAVAAADQAADQLVKAAAEARGGAADDTATKAYEQGQAAVRQAQAQVSAATSTSGRARAADALALAQVRLEGLAQAVRDSTIAAQSGSSGVTVTQRAAVVSSSTPRALLLGGFAGGVLVALVVGAVVVWRGSARR